MSHTVKIDVTAKDDIVCVLFPEQALEKSASRTDVLLAIIRRQRPTT